MSYTFFTAKIYDSLRQEDNFPRDEEWSTDDTWVVPIVKEPYTKGATLDTTGSAGELNFYKNQDSVTVATGDLMTTRFKHSQPIVTIYAEQLSGDATDELVEEILNVDFGSHYESYETRRITGGTIGRRIAGGAVNADAYQGVIKVWDFERIIERASAPAKPIYLATKQGITIEGQPAYPNLAIPNQRERGIDPSKTSATASKMDFKIYNNKEDMSGLLYERMYTAGTLFWNEKVEIFGHGTDLEGNNFKERIFFGLVKDITNDVMETEYTISTSDIFQLLKTELFSRQLSEYKPEGIAETPVQASDTLPDNFSVEEYADPQSNDPANPDMIRKVVYDGNPVTFAYGILDLVFSTPSDIIGLNYLNGNYRDYIDEASFENIRTILGAIPYDYFHFDFFEPLTDPFQFLQEQFFKPCTVFPYMTTDGKLGLKVHEQPSSAKGIQTFSAENIFGFREKKNSMSRYVNHIRVDYNNLKDESKDRFNKTLYAIQPEALEKVGFLYPKGNPLTFQFEGINFGFTDPANQDIVAQRVVDSYFGRYSTAITSVSLETSLLQAKDLHVGAYVGINHNFLVEWEDTRKGQRGLTDDITQDPDTEANYTVGDEWGGFIQSNKEGQASDGVVFLDTQQEEILASLLTGDTLSCKTNHQSLVDWMTLQGL